MEIYKEMLNCKPGVFFSNFVVNYITPCGGCSAAAQEQEEQGGLGGRGQQVEAGQGQQVVEQQSRGAGAREGGGQVHLYPRGWLVLGAMFL